MHGASRAPSPVSPAIRPSPISGCVRAAPPEPSDRLDSSAPGRSVAAEPGPGASGRALRPAARLDRHGWSPRNPARSEVASRYESRPPGRQSYPAEVIARSRATQAPDVFIEPHTQGLNGLAEGANGGGSNSTVFARGPAFKRIDCPEIAAKTGDRIAR